MFTLYAIGAALIVMGFWGSAINSRRRRRMKAYLSSQPDFAPSQSFIDCTGISGLAIDEQRKRILLLNLRKPHSHRLIDYRDLLSSELFEDGTTISSAVRSSQIGGAVVGGLILGIPGALIGGLSGKREISTQVHHIDLRLMVNDVKTPLHEVRFLKHSRKKGSLLYQMAMDNARRWQALMEVLIQQADRDAQVTGQSVATATSIADEIRKLAELQNAGLLSPEEFQRQKAKMLGA